ncbi:MAG: sigma 54-interacting transcriptional regulator [Desulfomonilaceae bacterium]|nr:sigma 54-interacting transcriptional regulator [Desulfomonilaceae bacterium]
MARFLFDPAWEASDQLEILELIVDNIFNGVMITDAQGYVIHFNSPYGRFLGVDPKEQIGRHCTEVIENTRMHIVAETGEPEINRTHRIRGQDMVVQRIPIKKDGKVIAVFGQVMFTDVRDVGKLAKKLSILESKVEFYERELISLRSTRYTLDSIVGVSDSLKSLKSEARKAAAGRLPVLISGESGTGKELFAQGIHHASPRRFHPFVRINCAAIPKDLLESELFGYEQGAFTGASSGGKPGKIEMAHRGTLFLDEIADLPLEMQPKLLRVLEERELERVGGTRMINVDFRLIAATNQNLEQMLLEGRFRKDLYYRLSVIPLHIPPLRERQEDIAPLARHILERISQDAYGRSFHIHQQTEEILRNYPWPGNARELNNVCEGIAFSLEGDVIYPHHLPFQLYRTPRTPVESAPYSLEKARERAEKEAIGMALCATGNNKAAAASLLGIHRTLLYKKMKRYGISLGDPGFRR